LSVPVVWGSLAEFARHPIAVARETAFITARLVRRPMRLLKFLAVLPKTLYLSSRLRKMDVAHIHSHWATVPTSCAMMISALLHKRFSFSAHAWDIYVTGNDVLLKEKIERAHRVFTCTRANQRRLSEFGPADKIEVMYHGIEMDRYAFEGEKPPSPPLILAGGSLVEQKGLGDFVDALAIVHQRGVAFRAQILGRGPLKSELESQIGSRGLNEIVELIGVRPHEDVIELMRQASVFVMPSKLAPRGFIDGLPNVVAEAMACGACVVGTRFSGIPELVEDRVCGLLVDPGDVVSLASAVETVLRDPELRSRLSSNAREKVVDVFDLSRNVKPLADYFENILAGELSKTGGLE